ncbi:putative quinol monooxygenase [Roseibium sediminicola]|uniref:Antibiotic biosynthesis monooxygenase n=1 Tax=Roseibium sediminicola TaxID=2933272 RepID=A0ABT0H236_9HYPH|nr:putative quinol monooxygenase [Roseibium sp. CAU 1639]MCK7615133.1 antibiotic biosynthesis monooxygenase [Roseibium sp. CAU 1639]
MFAVTVLFQIKEGQMDAFMPLMINNAQTSLKTEPGCLQFDVCADPARPREVFLYEIYDDEAAFKMHLTSAHFLTFDAKVADIVASKAVQTFKQVMQ